MINKRIFFLKVKDNSERQIFVFYNTIPLFRPLMMHMAKINAEPASQLPREKKGCRKLFCQYKS